MIALKYGMIWMAEWWIVVVMLVVTKIEKACEAIKWRQSVRIWIQKLLRIRIRTPGTLGVVGATERRIIPPKIPKRT